MNGKLVVFEGPDDVGKSTIIKKLSGRLSKKGIDHIICAFPGNQEGTLGKVIYSIHHNPNKYGITALNPNSRQLLHIAAHIETIEEVIMPAIRGGKVVLLDRYWWSTWVYGLESNMNIGLLSNMIKMEKKFWGSLKPNVVFLLKRKNKNKPDELHERLADKYEQLAFKERLLYKIVQIDNESSINVPVKQIEDYVLGIVKNKDSSIPKNIKSDESEIEKREKLQIPLVWKRLRLPKPSIVFDTYWKFAAERQEIFYKRYLGDKPPWTKDEILQRHKFTNPYRASDRVSQYLIRKVIYGANYSPQDLFFRIILFKTFNKIETWELLENTFGEIRAAEYKFDQYDRFLTSALNKGNRIYSGAYIMASGRSTFGYPAKHQNHLRLIERMMKEDVPRKIQEKKSMADVYDLLISYPTIGRFLAYQYCIDLNYSEITDFSENEFVVPGPGASDGLMKCFEDFGGYTEVGLIQLATERQEDEFNRLGIYFRDLWGRPLQLIDCQNLFCEVGKYARVAHPEYKGISDRKRIKQIFKPSKEKINFWYPPKWGLNEKIEAERAKE